MVCLRSSRWSEVHSQRDMIILSRHLLLETCNTVRVSYHQRALFTKCFNNGCLPRSHKIFSCISQQLAWCYLPHRTYATESYTQFYEIKSFHVAFLFVLLSMQNGTNSMKNNPTWEANSCSTTQKVPQLCSNQEFHYGVHKSPVCHDPDQFISHNHTLSL
jgi:hypothetical protein